MPAPAFQPQRKRSGSVLLVSADRSWLASTTAFLICHAEVVRTAEAAGEAIDALVRHFPDVTVVAPPLAEGAALTLIGHVGILREDRRLGIVYVAERERELAEHSRLMRAGVNDWFPRGLPPADAAVRIAALADALRDDGPEFRRGPLTVCALTRSARVGGADIGLADREFRVLLALTRAAGRALMIDQIVEATGARRGRHIGRSIADAIEGARAKLGAAQGMLESSRRYGYRLRFVAPP